MNAISNLVKQMGGAIIALIPARHKRLIFLSSIYARLGDHQSVDHETLSKLNRALALGMRDDALVVPVALNRAIWHGLDSKELDLAKLRDEELTKTGLRFACNAIIEKMPACLRYDEESVIREDLQKLFAERSLLKAA